MNEHARLCLEADRARRNSVIWYTLAIVFGWGVIIGGLWLALRWWL